MYQPTEARPGPNQASKTNLFARIVNIFKLTIFVKSTIIDV